MFEWLEQEISAVRTPRFHVVDGPVEAKLRQAVMQSGLLLPPSYREFVLNFGNAKLYRRAQSNSYRIGVFAVSLRRGPPCAGEGLIASLRS